MSRGLRRHRFWGRFGAVAGTFLILSTLMFSAGAAVAIAADTGAKLPGATHSPNEWTNAANALSDTDSSAVATAQGDDDDQGFSSFGFGVPAGSIVDGITVQVRALTSDNDCRLQAWLSGANGSNPTSTKTDSSIDGSFDTLTFGAANDTWGRVWDPTQLTNDNFVVVLRHDAPNGCSNSQTSSIDWVKVTVTYRTMDNGTANADLSKGVCNEADFNFVIDMSGSIGAQDGRPANLGDLQDGIIEFVDAFEGQGGSGRYSGTRFNGSSADELTNGYVSAASFKGEIDDLSGPTGTTPTAAGIDTGAGNDANDRGSVPNIMFVVTDGSPNVPGGDLGNPPTWLQAANAAIDAADAARSGGYIVKAVYLSTANDPGDTTLPFSNAGDAQWATKVMTEIGGGSFLDADFKNFANDLLEALKCAPPPTVELTKSVDDDSKPEPGGTFNYTLAIKNTSDHSVEITSLTDDHDLSQECLDLVGDTLAAGQTVTCEYSVDYSAIGNHPNEASVTVENEDGGTASDTDDATVEVVDLLPEVLLEKSVVPGSRPEPGGTFTFTLKITNISQETFVIDELTDDYPLSAQCTGLEGLSLAPGANTSCQYTVTRTNAGTYPNTAEVLVSDNEGNEDTDDASASFVITDVAPTIVVEKTAAPLSMNEPGGQFLFTVDVTNTSDEVVTITSLTDDKFGNLAGKGDCELGEDLNPDETYSCTFPGTFTGNAGASHTNIATAIAEDDEGTEATDSDDATVTLVNVLPDISVDKTVSQLTRPEPGGSFTFTVVVTNHSFEAVTLTSLVDNVHGNLNGQGTCATGGSIAANGGTYSCFFAADFFGNAGDSETDTVTAVAVDNDGTSDTDSDDATVSLTDVPPTVVVDKTADPTILDEPGGEVTFDVAVTNTSFETVTLDSLVDDIHGDLNGRGSCDTGGEIAPGATYECSFSATVSGNAGDFETDIVTAVVSDDEGSEDEDSDDATVTIVNVDPSIRVIKDATPLSMPEPGGSFRFDVTVINDSNEDVWLISLTDDIYGDLDGEGTCAVESQLLAANGGSYSCYFGGSFLGDAGDQQTDIVIATVVDDEQTERSNFDDATVSLTDVPPTIVVDKTASPEKVEAGTTVTFTVKVTNTSDETVWLTDLVDSIHGDLDGMGSCVADGTVSIAPDATYICAFSAVVNETETDVVVATVIDNEENEGSDDDDATVTVAELLIDKSVVNATRDRGTEDGAVVATPGDMLTYTLAYTLTNGPLHGVVITDVLPAGLGTPTNISDGGTYDAATRTLTWNLGTVDENGTVTYDVVVAVGADTLEQPLENIATIDSDETEPDDDDADTQVVPPGGVEGETSRPTLPPTDAVGGDAGTGSSGIGLALVILFLVGVAAVASILTVTPARVARRRLHRR
jgi:uncharacterized repeat protein (TIGR01451 family)